MRRGNGWNFWRSWHIAFCKVQDVERPFDNKSFCAIRFAVRHEPKSASFTAGEEARYQAP